MSYFLRNLPTKIKLDPFHIFQQVDIHGYPKCDTLFFQWKLQILNQEVQLLQLKSSNLNNLDIPLKIINNAFGLLLVSTFFNAVYKRHPTLALNAIYHAYAFNHNLTGLFITQALNRLSYAYFGLDYEEYRNHEDIKTRSVIEDFHSILAQILILPIATKENEGTVWEDKQSPINEPHFGHDAYSFTYKDIFIDNNSYCGYTTNIYHFISSENKDYLLPFFSEAKSNINASYGEFRALLNTKEYSTTLYKTFLPQPQNCLYEKIEIEKMRIKNKIKSDTFTFYSYPKELLELWQETAEILYLYLDLGKEISPKENPYKLKYKTTDENMKIILEYIERATEETVHYLIEIYLRMRYPSKFKMMQVADEEKLIIIEREVEACRYINGIITYFKQIRSKKFN